MDYVIPISYMASLNLWSKGCSHFTSSFIWVDIDIINIDPLTVSYYLLVAWYLGDST